MTNEAGVARRGRRDQRVQIARRFDERSDPTQTKSFFDTIDHGHLRSFLDQRVRDGVLRRTIDQWLKAGVLEEGAVHYPDGGTPQGGVISPLLANIYLHHILERVVPRHG